MIITYGKRLYGTLDKVDGSFITTRFFHLSMLPIIPLESHLVFVVQAERGAVSLGLHPRSVLAGYLRVWSPIALFLTAPLYEQASLLVAVPFTVLTLAATVWSWFFVGRLSAAERRERAAYAVFAGAPVDIGLLAAASDPGKVRDANSLVQARKWREVIFQRATGALEAEGSNALASYRGAGRFEDYEQVAEHPEGATPACKNAALTLAKLAAAATMSTDEKRASAERAHARISSSLGAG